MERIELFIKALTAINDEFDKFLEDKITDSDISLSDYCKMVDFHKDINSAIERFVG